MLDCSASLLLLFTAIFLHNSLKLLLTGHNQTFDHVVSSKPNTAVKRQRLHQVIEFQSFGPDNTNFKMIKSKIGMHGTCCLVEFSKH